MTSRERVLAAIAHEPTDRVPIDLGGMRSSGIMATAYNRLKDHLEMEHETLVYDVVQGLAQPHESVLERFGVDVVDLGRAWFTSADAWRNWTLDDGSPAEVPAWFDPQPDGEGGWVIRGDEGRVIGVMPAGQEYITQTYWPMADEAAGLSEGSLADLEYHMSQVTWGRLGCAPWHPGFDESRWGEMRRRALELRESTDRAIMCGFGGNLMEWSQFLRGFGQFLTDLAARPADAHRLLDALTERHLRTLDRFLDAVGDVIDIVQMGDDLGTQQGPQISPRMYREFFLPRHRQMYARVKERSELRVFLHSCGGLYELLPGLIEAGVEVLNPVQTSAAGMAPERLKRGRVAEAAGGDGAGDGSGARLGDLLTYWGGGCETQSTLIRGTPDDVRREVRERIAIFAAGGGYVFNQVHNILGDVPPGNVVAMFDAAREAPPPEHVCR